MSLAKSLRIRPIYTGSLPAKKRGIGYFFSAGLSSMTNPSAFAKAALASINSVDGGQSTLENPDVDRTVRREEPKVGRNDPCPCGSGKKYKNCCGKNA